MSRQGVLFSLEMVDLSSHEPFTVNSPRSIEAMRRQAIDNEEIQFKSLAEMEKFDEKEVDPDILEMRYSHFTERR